MLDFNLVFDLMKNVNEIEEFNQVIPCSVLNTETQKWLTENNFVIEKLNDVFLQISYKEIKNIIQIKCFNKDDHLFKEKNYITILKEEGKMDEAEELDKLLMIQQKAYEDFCNLWTKLIVKKKGSLLIPI